MGAASFDQEHVDRYAKPTASKGHRFDAFPPSSRPLILQWIETAKKPETPERRIAQTVSKAAKDIRQPSEGAGAAQASDDGQGQGHVQRR